MSEITAIPIALTRLHVERLKREITDQMKVVQVLEAQAREARESWRRRSASSKER